MALRTRVIGPISAYAIAVAKGYTGTEEEFALEIANASTNAAAAEAAAETAQGLVESLPGDFETTQENFAPLYADLTFPVQKGQHCIYGGIYYEANTGIASSEAWTEAHWTKTDVGGEISGLNGSLDMMSSASASDVGKALKAKTVTGGKVTEWEFGDSGQTFYTTGTLNLLDGVNWTAGSLGSSDPVPVEYGKKYTASFSAYTNRVIALDENKNELGNASTNTYISQTEVFSVWCKKWVYEIMNQSVKYIRFKQMSQPAAPYFLVEGDINMPYPLDVSTLTASDPDRDNLRKVIFGDEKVGFDDLRADISDGVKKLGYTDKVIESGDVQDYNAETYPLTFDDAGNVVMTDASALRSGTYVMLLKANVNGLYIDKFGYNIDSGAPSGGLAGPPAIVMQTNVGHTGYVLAFRTYGSKIAGISYIYSWNMNGTFTAADSSYSWASEYAIDSVRVKRNSDSFDFIFKDVQGTVTTKHFTFAQMHVTDPDALGIAWIDKKTSAVDNQMVIMGMKVSAPASITGGGTVTSPMNGAKYDAWGDSYTQGTGTYANMIAEQTGATLTNYGVSGNTVAQMYARMQAATVEGEYVSVLCGVNDYLTNTVMATFRTAVANVCAFIAASYTSAKALWVLPPQLPDNSANTEGNTLEDYVDAIKEICAANSVPVLDMYHAGNWYGTVAAFQTLYFTDSIHPSTAGHALLAGKVRKALEAL